VAIGLVLLSLGLVTVYLRESSDGALHGAQRIGVSVLTPFEVAGERVARPFQDAWGWTSDLFNAKDDNAKLRAENRQLRAAAIENQTARQENEHQRNQLNYIEGTEFPKDFKPVVTRVIVQPQTVYHQEIMVAAGSSNGVRVNDPVVTDEGLVGLVSEVTPDAAKVRLLTDDTSAASAQDIETGATGIILRGSTPDAPLVLDRVSKDQRVEENDAVVTAGSQFGKYPSLFPRKIPICTVTSVSQRDVDSFKTVQCSPLVDFSALQDVIVLIPKDRPS